MSDILVRDPIYFQASERLRALVRGGAFAPGQQFYTERQVSERFSISRATANKALASLVSEGLLEFRKGVGTFVRVGVLDYDLRALVSFTQKARAAGKVPSTVVRAFEPVSPDDSEPAVRALLQLAPDESITYIERLRLADNAPVILEFRYLRDRFCPDLAAPDVEASLYGLLRDRYQLTVVGADETIRAVSLTDSEAAALNVSPSSAALQVISVAYLPDEVPLWWERTLYRGDAYEFQNRLGPLTNAAVRPAVGTLRNT